MKTLIIFLSLSILYLTSFSQIKGTLKDQRDGKIYKTIKIGTQWIMAENLAYKPSSGKYWAYNNEKSNIAKFGYLYDLEAAKKSVLSGWHIPTIEEWKTVLDSIGRTENLYQKIISGGNSGLNVLFGGTFFNGKFSNIDSSAEIWSSSVNTNNIVEFFLLDNIHNNFVGIGYAHIGDGLGLSVRLFKN